MAVERLPEQQLTNSKTASQTMVSTLQQLNTLITALQTAAKAFVPDTITEQSAWTTTTAASSNSALAAALAGTGALAGSSTFSVTRVAAAGAAVSSGTVGSLTAAVASGPFLLTKGAPALGLTGVDAGCDAQLGHPQHRGHPVLSRRHPHRHRGPALDGHDRQQQQHDRVLPRRFEHPHHHLPDLRHLHAVAARERDRPGIGRHPHRHRRHLRPPAAQHRRGGLRRRASSSPARARPTPPSA